MKKLIIMLILLFPVVILAQNYIGVDKCKTCHKKPDQGEQFSIWEKSQHAKAFETLKGEEAAKIAKEKGLTVAAYEAPECLKCHVTGHDAAADKKEDKFKVEDGVQCESCHGPGSEYKSKKVMQDRKAAIEKGMAAILVKDGTAEKQCITCHNSESPTYKEFKFAEMWEKIKHPVPAAK